MPDVERQIDGTLDGRTSAAISTAAVHLLHEYTGRGPTKARTTISENLVVIILADSMTKAEMSLVADGKDDIVLRVRSEFQETMREDLVHAVEANTGRRVMAFMSANHVDPDMAAEVFVLEPQNVGALVSLDGDTPRT
jgi:uncharacterized protein YbcI